MNNVAKCQKALLVFILILTYIHNWQLQPLSEDYSLVSHITNVVCVNFIREWWDLQFKKIFAKLFYAGFICSQSFCQKSTYIHNWPLQPFSQDY